MGWKEFFKINKFKLLLSLSFLIIVIFAFSRYSSLCILFQKCAHIDFISQIVFWSVVILISYLFICILISWQQLKLNKIEIIVSISPILLMIFLLFGELLMKFYPNLGKTALPFGIPDLFFMIISLPMIAILKPMGMVEKGLVMSSITTLGMIFTLVSYSIIISSITILINQLRK